MNLVNTSRSRFSASFLVAAVAVVAFGCPVPKPTPDAGPGDSGMTHDAGQPMDSGFMDAGDGGFDGGPTDSGFDAGPPSISVSVAANPNCPLSAIATVTWNGPVESVYVSYSTDAGSSGQTPSTSLSALTSPHNLPVLGLRDSTTYDFVALGNLGDAGTVTSTPFSFTTGAMPSGVPSATITVADGGVQTPGFTLISAVSFDQTSNYVSIVDSTGYPVWCLNADPALNVDFQQQPDGTFTVAQYDTNAAMPTGLQDPPALYHQYDVLGNQIRVWQAGNPDGGIGEGSLIATDDHEIRIQPNGDALLYGSVEWDNQDLTDAGGLSSATVYDQVLERVTESGDVTFAWDAYENLGAANIDVSCTNIVNTQYVDYPHANAADVDPQGNYVLSFRSTSQIVNINPTTGAINWKFGGTDGQFMIPTTGTGADPLGGFSCQHGVRSLPNGHIIMFDDGNGHHPKQSRAVEYALDTTTMTATLVWASPSITPNANVFGYAQRLSTGNTLVTYGTALHDGSEFAQEFDPNDNVVATITGNALSVGWYRAYRIASLYGP